MFFDFSGFRFFPSKMSLVHIVTLTKYTSGNNIAGNRGKTSLTRSESVMGFRLPDVKTLTEFPELTYILIGMTVLGSALFGFMCMSQ